MQSEKETSERIKEGDRVVYIPYHAAGNRNHPDCEHGKVSSIKRFEDRPSIIFVKFDEAVGMFGWSEATAQGCKDDQLIIE